MDTNTETNSDGFRNIKTFFWIKNLFGIGSYYLW